ncbi:MAG: hypothetical protein M1414_01710 [Candidatus Thermoplasmatota archaeon]|jgi:predicted ArsR family transcriptional regulator|nr:hypothetical protein [Candidatus Thermoplasmatota archaeon]MCL5987604.1 hypothetical protein [Candidatus Thermoplasmatota archaeon]
MENDVRSFPVNREIFFILKKHGKMSLGEISTNLGISKTAALKWLVRMENEGDVRRTVKHNKMGRPSYIFSLSDKGKAFNEKSNQNSILLDLVDFMKNNGMSDEFDRYLVERYRKITTTYGNELLGLPMEERLTKLLNMRNDDGYMAELRNEPSGNAVLTEYNCPIFKIASKFPKTCTLETEMFNKVMMTNVENNHRQIDGVDCCVFSIRRKKEMLE